MSRYARFFSLLVAVSLFSLAAPAQAALTPAQVSSVILLLQSFQVDQATIAQVQAALGASPAPQGSVSFTAGAQPVGGRIAPGTKSIPFTAFTLTNNTDSPVVVQGATVTRTGSGSDSYLSSVELLDSAGNRLGEVSTLDQSHQATVGGSFTLKAGEVKTLAVAGSIASKNSVHSDRTLSLEVVSINALAALYGSLPIKGASYTIDTRLKAK
jgi:hypothetical protein